MILNNRVGPTPVCRACNVARGKGLSLARASIGQLDGQDFADSIEEPPFFHHVESPHPRFDLAGPPWHLLTQRHGLDWPGGPCSTGLVTAPSSRTRSLTNDQGAESPQQEKHSRARKEFYAKSCLRGQCKNYLESHGVGTIGLSQRPCPRSRKKGGWGSTSIMI